MSSNERIAAFPSWRYRFEFEGGVATPVHDRSVVNRDEQRRRYFFEPLLSLTGGSLRGRRVLDLGCNAGYWSLLAAEAGADFVLGVDARASYLEQAELVFEAKGIERGRYRFVQRRRVRARAGEQFDVVLCLGLLDHVRRPFELFELMARSGAELLVIDTEVSRARASLFELARLYNAADALEGPLVLVPSRQAVGELASELRLPDGRARDPHRRLRGDAGLPAQAQARVHLLAHAARWRAFREQREQGLLPWWVRDPRALLAE